MRTNKYSFQTGCTSLYLILLSLLSNISVYGLFAPNHMGSSKCPCLKMNELPNYTKVQISLCEYSNYINNKFGSQDVFFLNKTECLNKTYNHGFSCKIHDGYCAEGESTFNEKNCGSEWCYVDHTKCFLSNETYSEDNLISGFYYSYSTCSPQNIGILNTQLDRSNIQGKEFVAVVESSEFPSHFLETNNKNDNSRWDHISLTKNKELQGGIIDFLRHVVTEAGISDIKLVMPPQGGSINNTGDIHIAAASDVSKRLVDLSITPLYITPELTKMIDFTIPVYHAKFYLYQLGKESSTTVGNILNILKPFDHSLLIVTVCCIIAVGLLTIFFANSRGDDANWYESLHSNKWKSSSSIHRATIIGQFATESIINSFVSFFGNATEIDVFSMLPNKILLFGFGFFILITNASYTSNLATFLSIRDVNFDWALTMDKAVEQKLKICAPFGVEEKVYNNNSWRKANLVMMKNDGNYFDNAIDYIKERKCSVFIANEYMLLLSNDKTQGKFCKMGIVTTGDQLFDIPMGFTINSEYSAGLSQAILRLKEKGLTLFSSFHPYINSLNCDYTIILNTISTTPSNAQLNVTMMAGPMLVLTFSLLLAICIKIGSHKTYGCQGIKKKFFGGALQEKRLQNNSLFIDHGADNELTGEQEITAESLNLNEFVHQIDLLSLKLESVSGSVKEFISKKEKSK